MSEIKLVLNPYEPNHKTLGNLTLMVHAPYNRIGLAVEQAPPSLETITAEEPEKKVRTVCLSFCDPKTGDLEFNLDGHNTHAVHVNNKDYIISLQEIGEEETPQEPGRHYLYFIFNVDEI